MWLNFATRFSYIVLWNALNPLKCKCGYNYRANMTDIILYMQLYDVYLHTIKLYSI